MTNRWISRVIIATGSVLVVSGCMVGPKYQAPQSLSEDPPSAYKESPSQFDAAQIPWKVAQPQDAMLRGKWWEIFHDEELNALEEQVSINNQNIKQFFENFMAARSLIQQAASQLYPTVTITPAYTRSHSPSGTFVSGGSNGIVSGGSKNAITSLITVPVDVNWEPDLWGKVRNAIQQAQYNSQLSAADLENERLSEQSSLAMTYFQLRGQDALRKLLMDTIDLDQKSLDYTRAQFETGLTDQISVIEAETTLQSAQAAATNVGVLRAQYEHAIAVLVGKNPSQFAIEVKPSLTAPPPIPIGVPSQLLQRRPDVAGAERNMAAANGQIGIADAAYYPDLTLSAGAGFESSTLKDLFNWSNRFWSVGPSVSYTVFDAGLRRATVNQFISVYNADVVTYRQTVLTAFQQVEDHLASLRILSQQVEQESQAVASAQKFVTLEMVRYQTGVDPYIDVVTAQTTLLNNQTTLLNIQVLESTSAVQLVAALGGGWDASQMPTTQQVSKWPRAQETKIQR